MFQTTNQWYYSNLLLNLSVKKKTVANTETTFAESHVGSLAVFVFWTVCTWTLEWKSYGIIWIFSIFPATDDPSGCMSACSSISSIFAFGLSSRMEFNSKLFKWFHDLNSKPRSNSGPAKPASASLSHSEGRPEWHPAYPAPSLPRLVVVSQ